MERVVQRLHGSRVGILQPLVVLLNQVEVLEPEQRVVGIQPFNFEDLLNFNCQAHTRPGVDCDVDARNSLRKKRKSKLTQRENQQSLHAKMVLFMPNRENWSVTV